MSDEPAPNAYGHIHYHPVKSPNPPTLADIEVRRKRTRYRQMIGAAWLLALIGVVAAFGGAWPFGVFCSLVAAATTYYALGGLRDLAEKHPSPVRPSRKRRGF